MDETSTRVDLDRRRLEHRARRIEHVLAALRSRSLYRESSLGTVPAPLRQAIHGFDEELRHLRARLGERPRASRPAP